MKKVILVNDNGETIEYDNFVLMGASENAGDIDSIIQCTEPVLYYSKGYIDTFASNTMKDSEEQEDVNQEEEVEEDDVQEENTIDISEEVGIPPLRPIKEIQEEEAKEKAKKSKTKKKSKKKSSKDNEVTVQNDK